MPKDEGLDQRKENAILTISQLAEKDYNDLLDAIILVANAAKKKTSAGLIGIKAIMNEREPEPIPEPEAGKDTETKPGPEPGVQNNVE